MYSLDRTRHLTDGAIAECGVGTGMTMVYSADCLAKRSDPRHYHAFDTFQGFPYIDEEDLTTIPQESQPSYIVGHRRKYREFDVQHMHEMLRSLKLHARVTLHQGRFEETLPLLPPDQRFSYVFLDCDLYQSYHTCLAHLYPRMLVGGIMLFDEYEHTDIFPGAKKALDEFFADKPEKPEPMPFGTSYHIVKV